MSDKKDTIFIFDNFQNAIFCFDGLKGKPIGIFKMDSNIVKYYYNKKGVANIAYWDEFIKSKQYPQTINKMIYDNERKTAFVFCGVSKACLIEKSFDKSTNDSFVSKVHITNTSLITAISNEKKDNIIEIDSLATNTDLTNIISYKDKFLCSTLKQSVYGEIQNNIENFILIDKKGKVLKTIPFSNDIKKYLGVDTNEVITRSLVSLSNNRVIFLNFKNNLFFSFEITDNKIDKLKTFSPKGVLYKAFKTNEFNAEINKKYGSEYNLNNEFVVQNMISDSAHIYIYLSNTKQFNKGIAGILLIYQNDGTHLKDIKINFQVDEQLLSSDLIAVKNSKVLFLNKFKLSRWEIISYPIEE